MTPICNCSIIHYKGHWRDMNLIQDPVGFGQKAAGFGRNPPPFICPTPWERSFSNARRPKVDNFYVRRGSSMHLRLCLIIPYDCHLYFSPCTSCTSCTRVGARSAGSAGCFVIGLHNAREGYFCKTRLMIAARSDYTIISRIIPRWYSTKPLL